MPMRKSATEHSKRGLKRHAKNLARKKRSEDLKKFNDLAYRVKTMQAMLESQKEKAGTDE
jgi:hypothetical protein